MARLWFDSGVREARQRGGRAIVIATRPTFSMILASDEGSDPFAIFFLGGFIALILLPFLSAFTWLKGHRGAAILGLVAWSGPLVSFLYPIGNLEDKAEYGPGLSAFERFVLDWFFEFELAAAVLATLVVVFVAVFAFRLAKPHSWWAQRRYPSAKFGRSVQRYG